MADFQLGDVVHLKSGGPLMTITDIGDYGDGHTSARCTWFDKHKSEEKVFPLHSLKKEDVVRF